MTVPGAGALSRRQFLERGGAVVVSFAMPPAFLGSRPDGAWAAPGPAGVPDPARLDSWLALAEDGSVTVFTGALELGMGVSTAYAQIVAEELDVPFRSVSVVMGDTARTPDQGGIGGSRAIEFGARPLRNAAAEARRVLLELASARLGASAEGLAVHDGIVQRKDDPSKTASYGDLIRGRRFDLTLKVSGEYSGVNAEGSARPKSPDQYTIVGKPVPRIDIPDKVTARFPYVVDVRVPGMLHGRVIRPSPPGATLLAVDGARGLPGFVKVVKEGNFLGVVAETQWGAIQAARSLKVTWSPSGVAWPSMAELYKAMWAMPARERRVTAQGGGTSTRRWPRQRGRSRHDTSGRSCPTP